MQKLIPFAHQHPRKMPVHGVYKNGYPKGAVVHFTAGVYSNGIQDAENCIDLGIHNGFTYLCIARTGEIVQAHDVDHWGYHAGQSAWNKAVGFLGTGVNDKLIGIEMCNPGILTRLSDGRFKTYWGKIIPAEGVRYVTEGLYGCPTGYYLGYSPEQEATLVKTLLWLKANDPTGKTFSFDDVLGHHEVSGKAGIGFWRKNDPGGALSMPMATFREHLKALTTPHEAPRLP